MRLLVLVTSMVTQGYGDIWYAHYGLDLYPSDSNHIVGSIAKVLRDLEDIPKFASCHIFQALMHHLYLMHFWNIARFMNRCFLLLKKNQL
jgi:hypothetical protein